MPVKVIKYRSWDELRVKFDSLGRSWIFRGQALASWGLSSSLERYAPEGYYPSQARLLGTEFALLQEFRRRAHLYEESSQAPDLQDNGLLLALMQHHGGPTRLIDFTESPFVATYFAFEDVRPDDSAAVWALDYMDAYMAIGKRTRMERGLTSGTTESDQTVENLGAGMAFAGDRTLFTGLARFLGVTPFEPRNLSARSSIQQGMFMCAVDVRQSFEANLNAMDDLKILKFVVPHSERPRILGDLRRMNVTRASLFPGLDGFAQSLRTILLDEPPSLRSLRQALAPFTESGLRDDAEPSKE